MATVRETFEQMAGRFQPDKAAGVTAVIQFEITGEGGGTWSATIREGTCAVTEGQAASPTLTVTMAGQDWLDLLGRKLSGQMAFMTGKLKQKGDMGLLLKLPALFGV